MALAFTSLIGPFDSQKVSIPKKKKEKKEKEM